MNKKLLHIIATPRQDKSRTLSVAKVFLETFQAQHPDWSIDELDLWSNNLPTLTAKSLDGKYALLAGKDLPEELRDAWGEIIAQIERFMSADAYLISAPMWNFSIPYRLKQYLDVILQPRYLYRYTPQGPEGLVKNKKMVVITSRGGDYSGLMLKADFQEPYLRFVFGFVGIKDIRFINAQPMDMAMDLQAERIKQAQVEAQDIAAVF